MNRKDLPEPNAVCRVCGEHYYACFKCLRLKDQNIYGWKLFCDSPECYALFMAVEMYKDRTHTKEQTREMLNNRFPDGLPKSVGEVKEAVDEIYTDDERQVSNGVLGRIRDKLGI